MRLISLPDERLPAKLSLNPEPPMDDDEFYEFCVANPTARVERTTEGVIVIVPPAGWESDYRNTKVVTRLDSWASRDGRGKAFGPTSEFILPTGAALSPDAAWVSNGRVAQVPKDRRRRFPSVCPEFVIEVISPSDRLPAARKKMEEWIRAGVELAWLIDGDKRTVYVYRAGQKGAEVLTGIRKIAGEGPVAGFKLELREIWAGL